MKVKFDKEEVVLLTSVIDMHVMGIKDAKEATTDDPTIDTTEQLLDYMSGYDNDLVVLDKIRKKLINE